MFRSLTALYLFLLISICGAAQAVEPSAGDGKPVPVVVSLPAQKYLVERIAGDAASVTTLLQKGADPHSFEPTPAQMRAVAEARFYFTIGLPFEKAWLPRLAGAAPNLKVVDMTAGIKRLSSGEDAERAAELGLRSHGEVHDGHEHGEDPHVWLSPMLVRAMIPNVVKALAAERPGDAARFRAAAKTLDDELQALDAELAEHLGHGKNEPVANDAGNTRNGKSRKTLKGEFGELPIEVPRDRHGTFEPQLIPKHQTRWTGFDDKILSLYARGMTVREIQAHLEEMYGTEISPSLMSSIMDAVAEEVRLGSHGPSVRSTRSSISTASTSKCVKVLFA